MEGSMRRVTMVVALMLLAAGPAAAQGDLESALQHMDELSFLVGEWQGEGWMAMGPEQVGRFRGRETVTPRLDGLVLDIEGVHESLDPEREGEIVHHALARVSWDPEAQDYRFRTHLSSGRSGDFRGRVVDGAFVWEMEMPGRSVRYTIRLDDSGRWFEIGETSSDGSEWRKFFEMTLTRVDGE
jgi:hypothetical protein